MLGIAFATLGIHLKPNFVTAALISTYILAGAAIVVAAYLFITYTTLGEKRQPLAREMLALTLIFIAWLLTWAATFEVYMMQPRLPQNWTLLPFSYDITESSYSQMQQRQPFIAADGSTVILRITGSENAIQYALVSHLSRGASLDTDVSELAVEYRIKLDSEEIPGGPWTLDPEIPTQIPISNVPPSLYKDDMHVLSVYPVSGPNRVRLVLNCFVDVQKPPE
ncbi:MAG TPA: hypothetical protein VGI19_05185 [Candidatus Cybelea sp.]